VKTRQSLSGGGVTAALTQYSFDDAGHIQCAAVRMNSGAYGNLPSSACTLGSISAAGTDRIVRIAYDAGGQPTSTTSAYGTAEASVDAKSYTPNGQEASVVDASGNRTRYGYDRFDRLTHTVYPVYTPGQNASNGGDYEQLGYDANGEVTSAVCAMARPSPTAMTR